MTRGSPPQNVCVLDKPRCRPASRARRDRSKILGEVPRGPLQSSVVNDAELSCGPCEESWVGSAARTVAKLTPCSGLRVKRYCKYPALPVLCFILGRALGLSLQDFRSGLSDQQPFPRLATQGCGIFELVFFRPPPPD